MTSPNQKVIRLCPACGGPMNRGVIRCIERPGALTFVEMYDQLVLDDVSVLDTLHAPSHCTACGVDADQPHHVGCTMARCGDHRGGPRVACDCDARWLAAAARIRWRERLPRLRLRWPRWRRRRFRYGEQIIRGVADAHPTIGEHGDDEQQG